MPFLNLNRREPVDLDAVRHANPLASVVGASLKLIRAGREWKACCPFHEDRTPSFTLFGDRYHCFGCGASGDVLDFVQRSQGVGLREAADMLSGGNLPSVHVATLPPLDDGRDRMEEARSLWASAVPAKGTLAETYLHMRGVSLPNNDCIRFARLRYGKSGPEHPALIAAIAALDNTICGVQRTYLNSTGTGKAAVPKPKLSLGRVAGGAIRLTPCAARMAVTEGLEDGLSVIKLFGQATWVAAGASMMPSMLFPPGVNDVTVCGDADQAGRDAAFKAARVFSASGKIARVLFPDAGKDFNEYLNREGCA